jgi:hypothetical protein
MPTISGRQIFRVRLFLISAHFNAICHDVDLPPLGWGIAELVERGCEDRI